MLDTKPCWFQGIFQGMLGPNHSDGIDGLGLRLGFALGLGLVRVGVVGTKVSDNIGLESWSLRTRVRLRFSQCPDA